MLDVSTKLLRTKFYNSKEWRQLRQVVLERDNHECQECKSNGLVTSQFDSILEVDHIKELHLHPELATNLDNLRTLCKDCHNKKHKRMNYRSFNKRTNKWADDEFTIL